MSEKKNIVILGGGFAGAYCARRLEKLAPPDIDITVIDRHNYFIFYPLLIEAGIGSLEPRHAIVPMRTFLDRTKFKMGEVTALDTERRVVEYRVAGDGPTLSLPYDQLVVALGSVTRLPPVPGLAKHGFQMKSLSDAVLLRDRIVHMLERAASTADPEERKALLHFVVVGANFTGVEVAGEYHSFLMEALSEYPGIRRDDVSVTLLELAPHILPALDTDLADYAVDTMRKRGINIYLKTSVTEIAANSAKLSDGRVLGTHTVIWCAGIAPSPFLSRTALTKDARGYLACERDMRVKGTDNVWAAGDCGFVPDENGKPYGATAQVAVQQGQTLAENIVRAMRGEPTLPCKVINRGSLTALGGHKGAARVFGFNFSGFTAWCLFRAFYLMRMPRLGRKLRVSLDWFIALFSRSDVVQVGVHTHRMPQVEAPAKTEPAAAPVSR